MKTLEALNDTVIVEVNLNKEKKSDSGIFLPSSVDVESQSQAQVISVGEDVKNIVPGDWAIISRVGGEIFHLGGKTYYALKKTDIFAIIRETN